MTQDLLFEIGTEEIPSSYMTSVLKDLEAQACRLFEEQRIAFSGVRTLGTPRRLTLYVERLDQSQGGQSHAAQAGDRQTAGRG